MTVNDITFEIRGAIYEVYKELGPGMLESVYEEALCFELERRGLAIERQKQVPINYKGNVLKTELRLDLLVEDEVIVELKSVEEMKKEFGAENLYRRERSRKHRYIYFNAKGKRKKELLKKLCYKILPYPKA